MEQSLLSIDELQIAEAVLIEAVTKKDDLTVVVHIEGQAMKPTLTLDSEPSFPKDEILARLLFDREANQITPLQAGQLALALNRLRGGGGGFDVIGQMRQALGIDTLDISGGDGTKQESVRAGKYVQDNVYIELEKGMAEQSGRARVEVEILPNVSIEADTGEDAESGLGLKWQYDY